MKIKKIAIYISAALMLLLVPVNAYAHDSGSLIAYAYGSEDAADTGTGTDDAGAYMAGTGADTADTSSEDSDKKAPVVDIEIREFMLVDGELVPFEDQFDLLPGQNVSKIVRVYNLGDECNIRLKYSFDNLGEILNDTVYGISDKWVYLPDDGKWYYTEPLKKGEYAEFFKGFKVPSDLPQETEESAFNITIEAEAAADYTFTDKITVTNKVDTGVSDMTVLWTVICAAALGTLVFALRRMRKLRNGGTSKR